MEQQRHTTLIGNAEVRQMIGMQSQSGLNKLRAKDATFPKPIKTSDSRQARPRYDVADIEKWIASKKAALNPAAETAH